MDSRRLADCALDSVAGSHGGRCTGAESVGPHRSMAHSRQPPAEPGPCCVVLAAFAGVAGFHCARRFESDPGCCPGHTCLCPVTRPSRPAHARNNTRLAGRHGGTSPGVGHARVSSPPGVAGGGCDRPGHVQALGQPPSPTGVAHGGGYWPRLPKAHEYHCPTITRGRWRIAFAVALPAGEASALARGAFPGALDRLARRDAVAVAIVGVLNKFSFQP